jgi:cytochrome c553
MLGRIFMRNLSWVLVFALPSFLVISAQQPQPGAKARPAWAFPVLDKDQPPAEENAGPQHIPGSDKAYTAKQIDDLAHPPDWFPNEHGPLPKVVSGEGAAVLACGSCHLMSGEGHPESAGLAGFPVEYLVRQMADFKSGARKDPVRMTLIGKATSDEDAKAAAEYFASLKPVAWVRVVEANTLPKSYVSAPGRMRLPRPEGGMEPLGNRIVELPEDAHRVTSRDPHSGFVAYVPPGSIAKGKQLVMTGGNGKTISCTICHGDSLQGIGDVPGIAGLHPLYIARQLSMFQTDAYNGNSSALMKKVVAKLDENDMLVLAAYAASLKP